MLNIELPGYEFIHNPTIISAGGCAFYIKQEIKFQIRTELSMKNKDCEDIWLQVTVNSKPSVIGCIYRHPRHNVFSFQNTTLNLLNTKKKPFTSWVILILIAHATQLATR